jgi:hypothetical protein
MHQKFFEHSTLTAPILMLALSLKYAIKLILNQLINLPGTTPQE